MLILFFQYLFFIILPSSFYSGPFSVIRQLQPTTALPNYSLLTPHPLLLTKD